MSDEAQVTEVTEEVAETEDDRKIIRNHVIGSMVVGLIPVPILDLAGIAGFQLNMIRRLAKAYGIPFNREKVKPLVASLIGGGVSIPIGSAIGSLLKVIPVVGQITGALALPVSAGAMTYAVGRVFVQHFASGGTFLTFDPEKVRAYYAEKLQEGEAVASAMKA